MSDSLPAVGLLPATDVALATRVGFAVAHALLLVVVAWGLGFLVADFSAAAARALAEEPLWTALAAGGVGVPVAALWGLFLLDGLARLLAGMAVLVFGPLVLVADGLAALGVGWWLVDRAGHDPGTGDTAVAVTGAAAVAAVGVVPAVGPVLSAALVALGAGAGARALSSRLGHRGRLAAPR